MGDGARTGSADLHIRKSPRSSKLDTRPPGTFTREFFAVPEQVAREDSAAETTRSISIRIRSRVVEAREVEHFLGPEYSSPSLGKSDPFPRSMTRRQDLTRRRRRPNFTEFFRGAGGKKGIESERRDSSGALGKQTPRLRSKFPWLNKASPQKKYLATDFSRTLPNRHPAHSPKQFEGY